MLTYLVHKSVQLALSTAQLVPKVWEQGSSAAAQAQPHSTDVLSLFQLCKMNWTGVGREDSGRGLCFTGWVPGCLLIDFIVLQSVRSHYSYHLNSYL